MSASVVACLRCRRGPAQGRTAFFLNRNPSRRRNSQTALCETLTPRAASSSFSRCSVRCGVWPIRSRTKARCGSSTRFAVSADLAGRHRAGRTIALRPLHHRRYRNAKSRRHRAAALAANDCRNNTLSQIIGKRSGHRMLAPNPSQHLESQSTSQRNPSRFHQSVKRSRRRKCDSFPLRGNYYRSRFSEKLFKSERIPGWGCRKFEITDVVSEP